MVENIHVKTDVYKPISHLGEAIKAIEAAQSKFEEVDKQLQDDKWQGEAKDKCVHIQEALKLYCTEIGKLAEELKGDITSLKDDADSFEANSSNIKLIKSI